MMYVVEGDIEKGRVGSGKTRGGSVQQEASSVFIANARRKSHRATAAVAGELVDWPTCAHLMSSPSLRHGETLFRSEYQLQPFRP
jgi:hypothetical protein